MRLILVRHGETFDNLNQVIGGHRNTGLSHEGIIQAKKVGLRFKDRHIDALFSSDLKRAHDTAKEIEKWHKNLILIEDARIRERNYGEHEGKPYTAWDWNNIPEDAEEDADIYARIKSFFEDIASKYKNKTVLVVSHGGAIRAFLTLIHEKPLSQNPLWDKAQNTAVYEFEINESKRIMEVHNCTKHLE